MWLEGNTRTRLNKLDELENILLVVYYWILRSFNLLFTIDAFLLPERNFALAGDIK